MNKLSARRIQAVHIHKFEFFFNTLQAILGKWVPLIPLEWYALKPIANYTHTCTCSDVHHEGKNAEDHQSTRTITVHVLVYLSLIKYWFKCWQQIIKDLDVFLAIKFIKEKSKIISVPYYAWKVPQYIYAPINGLHFCNMLNTHNEADLKWRIPVLPLDHSWRCTVYKYM